MAVEVGSKIFKLGTSQNIITDLDGTQRLQFDLLNADYMHMLGTTLTWSGNTTAGVKSYKKYPVKRLTVDMRINIETNSYLKPSFRTPYYFLEDNVNNTGREKQDPDYAQYQNMPVVNIYMGKPMTGLSLEEVYIQYLKVPELVTLTDDEAYSDSEVDTSQVLEFPDYLKNEFVKRLTTNFLENVGDPRLNTQVQINQEIPPVPFELQGKK